MLYIFPFYILINHENFFKYSFQSIDNILFSFFMKDIIDYIKCDQVKPLLTRRISPIITSTVLSLWQFPSINRWRNPAFLRLEKLLTVYYVFHKLMPRTFNGVIASFVKRVRGQKRPYLPRSSFTSRFVKNLIFFYFFFFLHSSSTICSPVYMLLFRFGTLDGYLSRRIEYCSVELLDSFQSSRHVFNRC